MSEIIKQVAPSRNAIKKDYIVKRSLEIEQALNLLPGENIAFSFTTNNIKAWKTIFYKMRNQRFGAGGGATEFIFRRQKEVGDNIYIVWRTA